MDAFLSALQFLTIFPLKIKNLTDKTLSFSLIYFPVVGLCIGLIVSGINVLLYNLSFPSQALNIILVVALVCITGGMHLDGLSDTLDAFLSGKSKDGMLTIMRDPHIGVMGVISLICVILLKTGLLAVVLYPRKAIAVILMCIISRWVAVMLVFLFPYARQEGKAGVYVKGVNAKIFTISLIIAVLCNILIWQFRGLIVLVVTAGFAYVFGVISTKKINGITGDVLGAAIELSEICSLFTIILLERSNAWMV